MHSRTVRLNRTAAVWLAACALAASARGGVSAQQAPVASSTAPATAFLAGQVVDSPSGRALPGATVSLNAVSGGRGGGPQRPVITDSQGRFYFASLPAGLYSFTTLKSGYSAIPSAVLTRTTALAAGERITDLKINLVKLGAISGTLRDDVGDPVVGMTVMALRRTIANGRPTMTSPSQARSDDRGTYRISGLQPGDYVVCACARDPLPLDGVLLTTLAAEPMQLMGVASRALKVGASAASLDDTLRTFAPTLYPNSSTVARADRVTVKTGEEKGSVDINLTAVKAVHISGTVTGSPSPLNATSAIRLTPSSESDEGATLMQMVPMLLQPDGRFDFVNVPSGSYVLRATVVTTAERSGGEPTGTAMTLLGRAGGPPPPVRRAVTDPWMFASVPIVVGDRDLDGVPVVLRAGPSVSGQLRVFGGGATPSAQDLARSSVFLGNLTLGQGFPGANGIFNPDGTFRIVSVSPGKYALTVSVPSLPTLKSIEIGGVDVVDLPVEIAGDLTDVVITMGDGAPASISGTALRGGLIEDDVVLVFPTDRRLWTDPSAAFRRYRSSAVSRAGIFNVNGLPAGDYYIAIVSDAQSVDWQQSARFDALSKTATKVTLAEGEKKVVEVKR